MKNVHIDYTNWRNERAWRLIEPVSIYYGHTPWHLKDQWLLKAVDLNTGEERDFALSGIHEWKHVEPASVMMYLGMTDVTLGDTVAEQVAGFKRRLRAERVWPKVYVAWDGQTYRPVTRIDAAALRAAWDMDPAAELTVYLP